ncbi:dihydroxyacetone kinase subunit DhaL [Methylomonas fluvii]|uniref:Dihydroxyacetone kinase subunit L n=1 Tax=Methylomonas fluvii TaxID=1854564 RepID=A0ABR9DDQ6_9GAMM|nr:dihydroxyacetone kinase subunit DhaL [Methylomonas fluvii]MBD9361232.1 dihydroxyacetone kinase subunit L [Methylomonas fluvii]CAD6874146.1 Phosphoenolpyruvate-dihydroxyacetone phosphotransferase (EC 2.7.1.121), ADP-binding subunit DhaL [Methylomonas fluvii]
MSLTPSLFPELIQALIDTIDAHAEEVTELDQAIGDGDHVFNLQRGLQALREHASEIAPLDWVAAWQKIGMTVMAAVGGASGSLYATLFIALAKNSKDKVIDLSGFSEIFQQAVEAVKQRGKADVGEKTMLDVLVPVALALRDEAAAGTGLGEILDRLCAVAAEGVEATREMLATKGRASFLGERSKGHIDAGAKTAQLMIAAIAEVLKNAQVQPA